MGLPFAKPNEVCEKEGYNGKKQVCPGRFCCFEERFLNDVAAVVTMEDVPPELVLNWDQTGIHLVPASTWRMDKEGSKRIEMSGVNGKRQITAVFCGTLTGDFLPLQLIYKGKSARCHPLQLIYKGKSARCHPRFRFLSDWHVTHSPKHLSTEETMVQYINEIVVPYVEAQRDAFDVPSQTALAIMDNFKGQVTTPINELL